VNATSTATGQTVAGSFAEFRFSASHAPVAVTGGQAFWIVILNQSATCNFAWETSGQGASDAQFSTDGGSSWNALANNLAVCIGVTAGSPCGFAFASQDRTTFPSPFAVARMFVQLYVLRDDVMRPTTTGRRWISLYYEHGRSMKRILKRSPRLRRRVAAFVAIIGSGVEALADGNTEARVSRWGCAPGCHHG
jgi:hypothetical protein